MAPKDATFDMSPEMIAQLAQSGGNAQLAQLIQKQLSKMVGASSGYIESLPAPVQRRIDYLRELESERNHLEEQFEEELRALEQKYTALYKPLFEKRAAVVQGKVEAPENETEEGKKEVAALEDAATKSGIEGFWAGALRNHPELSELITDKDAEVLAFLTDVDVEEFENEETEEEGFRLVFSFRDNPFFENDKLVKTYNTGDDDGELMLSKIEASPINWKPGKNVTVKVMKKKTKPGQKNKGPQTKTEEVESFFRWFTEVPEVPDEEDDLEEEELEALQQDMEADYDIACLIRDKIHPNACSWFTGEALMEMGSDEEEEDEEEEGDDDDEGSEEEDDDSEEEEEEDAVPGGGKRMQKPSPAKDTAQQPQECKQQ